MYKRSHVIGSIAVLMISFLVLLGCPTDAGTDEPGPSPGSETVPPGGGGGGGGGSDLTITIREPVSVEQLEIWGGEGRTIVFAKTVVLTGTSTAVDLGTANITVNSDVTVGFLNNTILRAEKAVITFASATAKISLPGTGVFIADSDDDFGNVTATTRLKMTEGAVPSPLIQDTAVAEYTFDAAINVDSYKLYVLDTLTIPGSGGSVTGSGSIVPLGTVDITGSSGNLVSGFTLSGVGTLKKGATPVSSTVTLPTTVNAKNINVTSGTLTLGGVTDLTTAGSLIGGGTLTLPATGITAVTIDGGAGKLEFTSASTFGTITALSLNNTGGVKFGSATPVTIPNGVNAVFGGDVESTGGITTAGNATIVFNGNVVLADTAAITFGAATTNAVTLKAGKSISVKGTGTVELVKALTETKLTPVAGAVLTAGFTAGPPNTGTLTLETAGLSIASGTLSVLENATLETDDALTVAAGSILDVIGDVTITSTGSVELTGAATNGAKLTGTGTLNFGNATISAATGDWQAVGASTKIAFAATAATTVSITGTGTSPKLVGGADAGAISAGTNAASGNSTLTVSNAEIDLTTGGSIIIPYNTTASVIKLVGGTGAIGKLTLDSTQTTAVTATHYAKILKSGEAGKAGVTGTSIVVTGGSDAADTKAGSIAGGTTATTNDASITGLTATNDVTLDNTAVFADS